MPALLPACALTLGIILGVHLAPGAPLDAVRPLVALALAAGTLAWVGRQPARVMVAVGVGCGVCGMALGAHAAAGALAPSLRAEIDARVPGFRLGSASRGTLDEPLVIEGVLAEDAAVERDSVVLSLDVARVTIDGRAVPAAGGLRVGVNGALAPAAADRWRAGRRVRAPVLVRRPSTYLDDGVPDFERDLALGGTALVGVVKSAALVEVVAPASWPREAAGAVRAWARRVLAERAGVAGPEPAAVVTAILIGDRAGLTPEAQDRLQRAGTFHVIAISGGNIALLVGVVLALLAFTGSVGRVAHGAAIALVVAYAGLVTGGASVARATVMAAVYLGARLLDHRSAPLNAAAVTVILLLAAVPLDVLDVGFQLTVGATVGIVVVAARVQPWMPRGGLRRAAAALLVASAAADAFLLPIAALVFSRLTLAGLALNFTAIPLMSVAQIAGLIALVTAPLAPASAAAGAVAAYAAAGLLASARAVDVVPWLAWRVPPPPVWLAVAYTAALLAATTTWWHWRDAVPWKRWLGRSVTAAAVVAAGAIGAGCDPARPVLAPRMLRVTHVDVGQGDATLVQCPDGRSMLVDAGGGLGSGFDVGARVVTPAVWARGVRRLEWLVLTHGDPDHIGGAMSVLGDLRPREVWEGIPVAAFQPLQDLHARATALGIGWRQVYDGTLVEAGGVLIHVWHPPVADWERMEVRNNDSVVIELRYGDVSIVLPGDAEGEAEQRLAARLRPAPLRVVKMPHHGSRTSSSAPLLAALAPAVAIASAGRGNRFGHPAPDVVARYAALGASIWRTDRDGEITVETDGHTVNIRSFTGRSQRVQSTHEEHEETKNTKEVSW